MKACHHQLLLSDKITLGDHVVKNDDKQINLFAIDQWLQAIKKSQRIDLESMQGKVNNEGRSYFWNE